MPAPGPLHCLYMSPPKVHTSGCLLQCNTLHLCVCMCGSTCMCVCVCVHPYVPQFMYRGQRMTVLSTMRIKLSSFGSTTSTLSSRPSHRHSSGLSVYLSTALTSPPLWKLYKCVHDCHCLPQLVLNLAWSEPQRPPATSVN